jgi:hypothetical protein
LYLYTMDHFRLDRTKFQINTLTAEDSSAVYWRTLPAEKALEAIQFLRLQFHPELNDSTTRLQRIYSITKLEER